MKRIVFSVLSIVFLVGCLSNEGKKLIESPNTQRDVKELVEETLAKEEVPVKAKPSDAIYKPIGKGSQDEELIRVSYDTVNEPVFQSYAFVEVDTKSKPRQLIKVSESGLLHNVDYDLYEVITAYTFQRAYETPITKLKDIGEVIPHIVYEADEDALDDRHDPYVDFALDRDQLSEGIKKELLVDFAANTFASPTEAEAKSLLDKYVFLEMDIDPRYETPAERTLLPDVHLHYTYEGTFDNNKMNDLLDKLRAIEGLPDAFYTINVEAEEIEKDKVQKAYNKDRDGNFYHEFIGYLQIDRKINDKSNSSRFINEGE